MTRLVLIVLLFTGCEEITDTSIRSDVRRLEAHRYIQDSKTNQCFIVNWNNSYSYVPCTKEVMQKVEEWRNK